MYGEALHSKNSKFIWIIRDYSALNWFWEELKLLKDMEIDVYVTRGDEDFDDISLERNEIHGADDDLSHSEKKEEKSSYSKTILHIKKTFPHVNFFHAKPTMQQLVSTELLSPGLSYAFVACGHPAMVDDMREVVSRGHKEKRVDFYEHLQVWA